MKKFFCSMLLSGLLLLTSCRLNDLSKVDSGMKVAAECCRGLSAASSKTGITYPNAEEISSQQLPDNYSLLPYYSWDSKMLIW